MEEKIKSQRVVSSMGANKNNNNSYSNNGHYNHDYIGQQPCRQVVADFDFDFDDDDDDDDDDSVAVFTDASEGRLVDLADRRYTDEPMKPSERTQKVIMVKDGNIRSSSSLSSKSNDDDSHNPTAAATTATAIQQQVKVGICSQSSYYLGTSNSQHHHRHHHNNNNNHNSNNNDDNNHHSHPHHHQRSKYSLFLTILLPFILVFLLPSFKINQINHHDNIIINPETAQKLDQLLLSLIRLPLDRFRLTSGYSMMLMANAKEIYQQQQQQVIPISGAINTRQANDLQEEETHMMVMAPEQQQQQQQQQQQHRQSHEGYQQLAPIRQTYSGSSGGGSEQDPYGHDYVAPPASQSNSATSHANLINSEAGNEESAEVVMPASASGSVVASGSGSTSASAQQQTRTDLPSVRALNVKCEKNHMTVNIVFDRPFYGTVFSKGHYNDQKCVHLPPNSGQTSINFDIHLGKCGMSSSSSSSSSSSDSGTGAITNGQQQALQAMGQQSQQQQQQQPNGLFIENTIIIQYDPQVQEIYDQARRLRCTWYDYYEKSVTFRPYNVDMLDAVTANFLGDNIQCWMQIQVGKGPWSSEVAGIVKIGQTMTMVLAIKDDENKFDMLVRNCVASDGKHQPIQLVDEYGCVARPKIMAKFQKVRNFGPAATVVSYAHFQAFKFPDSMSVHFQCVIQVCRYECPEPVCSGGSGPGESVLSAATTAAAAGGGSNGGVGGVAGPQDFAASSTELVSSKEPLPGGIGAQIVRGQNMSHFSSQSSNSNSNGNSVNLKLDESQGRVQVKLDTSMMANNGLRPSNSALPPHLLHQSSSGSSSSSQQDQISGGGGGGGRASHSYLSSSYYKPSVGSATASAPLPMASRPIVATPMATAATATATMATNGQVRLNSSPSGGQHHQQYSSPAAISSLLPPHHNHHPRPAYMMINRMGELVAEDTAASSLSSSLSTSAATDNDEITKLSLIASPRALPYAMPTTSTINNRYRRSIINSTISSIKIKRQTLQTPSSDSTAIKTQRTIQVVSPDDVAFNLIDLDPLANEWPNQQRNPSSNRRTKTQQQQYQYQSNNLDLDSDSDHTNVICFSAGKFITSVLASLALLVTLVLVAILVILRQRKRLDQKLSPVYDSSSSSSSSSSDGSPEMMINHNHQSIVVNHHMQQQQQQQQRQRAAAAAAAAAAEEMILRRQREEIQQRNTYLGRLYSQFLPAAYWR